MSLRKYRYRFGGERREAFVTPEEEDLQPAGRVTEQQSSQACFLYPITIAKKSVCLVMAESRIGQ